MYGTESISRATQAPQHIYDVELCIRGCNFQIVLDDPLDSLPTNFSNNWSNTNRLNLKQSYTRQINSINFSG
ncbi:Multidrug efflux pump subunit AcrB [Pseudomonas syringae pv. actinidiae]|uniref:Multidrug efflux pump subunit AcrB n=1 Tax=Pseudomonas syringae pv. actinidiae TaxID=103796 RepID=A0AAN4Q2Q6_PSESF|nr:Multidrug efflux pump subunit AcrB [Pseudomonas syringae pv. actinidiae]